MKIAILGPSTDALHITHDLMRLGASVRLFWQPVLENEAEKELFEQDILIPATFKSVTKRFLVAGEVPKNRSRFADLFRVSYEINPMQRVEEVATEQPEIFEKLTSDFMLSLKSRLELFEDFDVVIDATEARLIRTLGPGGPSVGESRLREGTLFHLHSINELKEKLARHEIALIGDGSVAASALKSLKSWWTQNKESRIFVVTNQGHPFENYLKKTSDPELSFFLSQAEREQEKAMDLYQEELAQWEELDDFVKVKKTKPSEPIPRLVFFSAHIVSSVDQLIDKSRTFLTLEMSPWNEAVVQVENNQIEMKTIGVDFIVAACGRQRDHSAFHGLDLVRSLDGKFAGDEQGVHPEIGFFSLQNSMQRERIIENLLKLFSPKESPQ